MLAAAALPFVAGTALKAGAGLLKADATYRAGREEKRQAMTEAAMTEAATRQADMEAREEIARTRIEHRRFTGSQRATLASSGVVGTTGSPADILARTAALQELQIQDMARSASTAYSAGYARAKQIRVAGKAALAGAKRSSYGQIIGATAGAAADVYGGIKEGVFTPRTKSLI